MSLNNIRPCVGIGTQCDSRTTEMWTAQRSLLRLPLITFGMKCCRPTGIANMSFCVCATQQTIECTQIHFLSRPPAVGAGASDRGAAATGSLPEHDPGPEPPCHGAQRSLRRGGVPRRVAPAPQQGVTGRQQASQRCPAQRLG